MSRRTPHRLSHDGRRSLGDGRGLPFALVILVIAIGGATGVTPAGAQESRHLDRKTLLARFEQLDARLADAVAVVRRELPDDFLTTVKSLTGFAATLDSALPNVDRTSVAASTIVLKLREGHTNLAMAWKHAMLKDGGATAVLRAAARDFARVAKEFSRDARFGSLTARFRVLNGRALAISAVPTVRAIRALLVAEETQLPALPRAAGVRLGIFYVETSRLRGAIGHAMRTTAHRERLAVLDDLLRARETNRALYTAFRNARG